MIVARFAVVWEFWFLWRGETGWPSRGGRVLSTSTKSQTHRRGKGFKIPAMDCGGAAALTRSGLLRGGQYTYWSENMGSHMQ